MSLLTGLALTGSMVLATPALSLLAAAMMSENLLCFAAVAPLVVVYGLGVWATVTVAAGALFDRRREQLLPEVLD